MATDPHDRFDLDDLDLDALTVVGMRDSVALPETGASGMGWGSSSCSCCYEIEQLES